MATVSPYPTVAPYPSPDSPHPLNLKNEQWEYRRALIERHLHGSFVRADIAARSIMHGHSERQHVRALPPHLRPRVGPNADLREIP